jgi:hypothetical protein
MVFVLVWVLLKAGTVVRSQVQQFIWEGTPEGREGGTVKSKGWGALLEVPGA